MKTKNGMSNIDIVRCYLNGERPFTIIGYDGEKNKYRKEGETWTDRDGIMWKKENGTVVRLTESQADIIRKTIGVQKCKCGMEIRWGNDLDKKFYYKTKLCYDCLVEYETRLRIVGLFPLYEKIKLLSNEEGYLKEFKGKIIDTINFFKADNNEISVLCNSAGFLERFKGTNSKEIVENGKADITKINIRLKEIKKELPPLKKQFKAESKKYKLG